MQFLPNSRDMFEVGLDYDNRNNKHADNTHQ